MFGTINVDKPPGITSRDVVNRVTRLVPRVKVGHAGTLDPLARGVLVLCLGPATRLIQYVQQGSKRYEATFQLGLQSDTDDVEGQVEPVQDARRPTRDQILQTLPKLTGDILQRPPAYSAVKVQGQRAYKRARAGEQLELAARPVHVYDLQLRRYDYPQLMLDIHCGSGTYVRAIGRDLANSLGTSAVMSALTRTAVGAFRLADAVSLETLEHDGVQRHLMDATTAVADLPHLQLSPAQIEELRHGRCIERPTDLKILPPGADEVAGLDADGLLVALLAPRGADLLRPRKNFAGD